MLRDLLPLDQSHLTLAWLAVRCASTEVSFVLSNPSLSDHLYLVHRDHLTAGPFGMNMDRSYATFLHALNLLGPTTGSKRDVAVQALTPPRISAIG